MVGGAPKHWLMNLSHAIAYEILELVLASEVSKDH